MHKLKITLLAACMVIGGWLTAAYGAEPVTATPQKLCLGLMQIDSIDILDNRNIVFKMDNGEYYLNQLPYTCGSLYKDKAIMYKTTLSELCNVDIITVLNNIGGGYMSEGSCGLGKFKPISKAEYGAMKHNTAEK